MTRYAAALLVALLVLGSGLAAQLAPEKIDGLEGVEVSEKLGSTVPLALSYRDEAGKPIRLSEIVDGKKPILLTLNYSDCPLL